MHFEGAFDAPVSREEIYSFLIDPRSVITIIPDLIDSRIVDEDHFSVKAKVGMGPLHGVVDMDFSVAEKRAGEFAKLVGRGRGVQSSLDLTLSITLKRATPGCRASWSADVNVGGMLASTGGRLIGAVAEKYVRQVTENLNRKMANPSP